MKKTSMFTGIKDVFSFTVFQNMKNKSFIPVTLIISIVVMAIVGFISMSDVIFGDDVEGDSDIAIDILDEEAYDEDGYLTAFKNIYVLNETEYSKTELDEILNVIKKQVKSNFVTINKIEGECIADNDGVVLIFKHIDGKLKAHIVTTKNTNIDSDYANQLGYIVINSKNVAMVERGSLTEGKINMIGVPFYASSTSGDDDEDEMVDIAKLIVPMFFCLFMYMIIMIYGQTISKAIIADKSSKLIETLLTSVKPYAIIGGKIGGSVCIAVVQTAIFVASGFVGYYAGDAIAFSISDNHENILGNIIKVISGSSDGSAFSPAAVIIAILAFVTGFMLYSTLAGFSASFATKIEDMSSTLSIFMIPLMAGFMISYFAIMSMIGANGLESSMIADIARYIPITSPFMLSADIMVGNIDIVGGVISYAIMAVTTLILIIATGKVYKGKIFNVK